MTTLYLKAVFPVFPAQAGNQCHDKVPSSTNAQLDTRVREYDEAIASLKTTVFPAQAGNQKS
jgi:hypothetical protein